MLTQLQELQVFWTDWGNHDLDFYKVYVQCGAITKADYKTVTGQDYDQPQQQADGADSGLALNTGLTGGQGQPVPQA